MTGSVLIKHLTTCMTVALVVLGLQTILLATLARADFINGSQLKNYCRSDNPNDEAICIVYITGAVDAFTTIDLIAHETVGRKKQFCLTDAVQPEQLRVTTLAWLERPVANLDFSATLLVLGAMKHAYGCKVE